MSTDLAHDCSDRLQFKTKIYLNKENDNGFYNAVVKLFGVAMRKAMKDMYHGEVE